MECQICNNKNIEKVISLGHQPPSDAFLTEEELNSHEVYYPLDVYFCDNCKLAQLGYKVDPKVLFNETYAYNTSTNKGLVKHFSELTEHLINKFNITQDDLAVDIGSNDGTLLENYQKHNIKVLGVEPSGVADMALEKNIPTIKDFFNEETSNKIVNNYSKAKVITATNVFAHVAELDSFMKGIKLLLNKDGVFVSESHYLLNLIKDLQYDSIYHEHLRYYSLKPLIYLFNLYNMDVFDVSIVDSHGGSIRIYACHKGDFPISDNIDNILRSEEDFGLFSKDTFVNYNNKIIKWKDEILNLIKDLKSKNNKIVCIGAPAKGNTLLNYFKLGPDMIDYLAEYSKLKINKYSPGMHIKVEDENLMFSQQPEYAILLSWNLKDIIVPKLRAKGYNGKIIVLVPKLEII